MSAPDARSVATLPEQLAALPSAARARVDRLFVVTASTGSLVVPPEMRPWIERSFGAVGAVERQRVIKALNRWTLEGTLYNDLRARRPLAARLDPADSTALDEDGADPFCHPLTGTPADGFGRVEGPHATTASNVAKYDGLHGVVIFRRHNPQGWDEEQVVAGFETAEEWLRRAHAASPDAVYPFVMWNCLPRSGASIVHAHMQMTLGEGGAYARVEAWRIAAERYGEEHGAPYLDALYAAHEALGLAGRWGAVRWLAHLTPAKEKELLLLAGAPGPELWRAVYRALALYRDALRVRAFNLAVYRPPLAPTPESWEGWGVVVRLVDRGDPGSATSDIGAMELYAQPVVASDPWRLADALQGTGTG